MADTGYGDYQFFLAFFVNYPVITNAKPVVLIRCANQSDDVVFQDIGIFSEDEEFFFYNLLKRDIDLF